MAMTVEYSDKAKQGSEGNLLLERATKCLEEVIGHSADLVKAEWDRGQDARGRIVYTLRLSDWTGSVSASFTPDELQSRRLRSRLNELWGDLLQIRSHKLLQELTGSEN